VGRVGRDHPDIPLPDFPNHIADRHLSGSFQDIPDLIVRHMDMLFERPLMALEDKDARLRTVTDIGSLKNIFLGEFVFRHRLFDALDVDLGTL